MAGVKWGCFLYFCWTYTPTLFALILVVLIHSTVFVATEEGKRFLHILDRAISKAR